MKRKVLLCTNSLLTRETLYQPLQTAECDVLLAADGPAATARCTGMSPDLLIVDLDSPVDGGGEAYQVVRDVLEICPWLPVIVISGRTDVSAAVESLGVAAVADKPIDMPALMLLVDELIAEPVRARTGGVEKHARPCRRLPPNIDAFREALRRRASAPFRFGNQPRNWGLNE